MMTFWSPVGSYVHRQWLRWGFLVIGAFSFADVTKQWLDARADPETIPYGEIEGIGHSDPTKLVFDHGWPQETMISRYLWIAGLSLLAVAVLYGWGVYSGRRSTTSPRQ